MTTTPPPQEPDLFAYRSYRAFLRDTYAFLKATKPQFSHRYFARQAGFAAPNYLKLVMDGRRNLTPSSILRFAKALRLDRAQREFFTHLVLMEQARSEGERNLHYDRLSHMKSYLRVRRLERDEYDYYSTWYAPPIRELVAVEGFREEPAWIARQLEPAITPAQAADSLDLLLRLDLLRRDGDGRLVQADAVLSTGPEVKSLAVRNFHRAMIQRAEEALDRLPVEERHASSLTVAMSRARAAQIVARVHELRRMLLEAMCACDAGEAREAVYQLNIQLFPLTRRPGGSAPRPRREKDRSQP
ncbi:MAG: TIGR02147 family protein [Myxococcota bacterium]